MWFLFHKGPIEKYNVKINEFEYWSFQRHIQEYTSYTTAIRFIGREIVESTKRLQISAKCYHIMVYQEHLSRIGVRTHTSYWLYALIAPLLTN